MRLHYPILTYFTTIAGKIGLRTMSSTSTDLLVIGGGPAGLSATLMFARLNRPVVMYDSGKYRNGASQHSHTIPGSDGESPADWRRKVREQVEANYKWVETRDDRVESLEKCPKGGFEAVDSQGRKVVARKVILATGLKDVLTDIPGQSILSGPAPS